ncbi:MAG: flagellar biosynthesis protein FliR [Acetomicrobium sp.]|jgi:flagellar biosynthesis protein FliR|uniref:flagellar biosynthesis protein FliR n=1 Tax=Acetomicrobium sp. TaxID=1872099 RepID=UPI001699B3D8|nr:flagellar biosynthesis protein FliR [Acetomicrobium sp.]MDI9377406.1 flagellar biosynthesis protein FliR [Synergistota bacterium]NLI43034.1 flagellar biosynthesis protein FliR [Synergistaceae bacterium]MDR9770718.1 flagellar biosynthesis protein FliR [Acetomicrobium sp.]HOB10298.1 flagellar biosynthesis protein FliR [Acetomicrobium sp.]HPT64458.1 flagellar biosynthesis protein FliR [Acetomicrobium sp.]
MFRAIPDVNIQALLALGLFLASLLIARIINNINSKKWPGGALWVFYLRVLLGFMLAASVVLGFYAFAGISILN